MNWLNIIRGIGGEPEIIRTLGALGVLSYIIAGIGFTGWTVFGQGHEFDIVAFCAAYPTGLGVAIAAIAGSNALKDRNVAVAQVTRNTQTTPGSTTVQGDLNTENIENVQVKP